MIKILFVCHGNICRSTMAQSVFSHLVRERGIEEKFSIDSFATSTEEIGNPPHQGTVQKLREVGIGLIPHRAQQITKKDFQAADLVIGMDTWNIRNLHRMFPEAPEGKIQKLLQFAGSDRDIADPWYTGNFDETYQDVLTGCEGLLKYLQ